MCSVPLCHVVCRVAGLEKALGGLGGADPMMLQAYWGMAENAVLHNITKSVLAVRPFLSAASVVLLCAFSFSFRLLLLLSAASLVILCLFSFSFSLRLLSSAACLLSLCFFFRLLLFFCVFLFYPLLLPLFRCPSYFCIICTAT